MLAMNDFRDLIIPLSEEDIDIVITKLLNQQNRLQFVNTDIGQEYNLSGNKKIVRRLGPENTRSLYQSVALFIKNDAKTWPPEQIEIKQEKILSLMWAMITLYRPEGYCIINSLRNLQYLLAILWVKKNNPKLLQGTKKTSANEIFRISLVK